MGSLLLINQLIPHRSTENYSDKIRWSVDLRWQRPNEPSGFEQVKECILMRTARDPSYRIDWTRWAKRKTASYCRRDGRAGWSTRSKRRSRARGSVAGPVPEIPAHRDEVEEKERFPILFGTICVGWDQARQTPRGPKNTFRAAGPPECDYGCN